MLKTLQMNEPQHSRAVIAAPFGTLLLEASDRHLLSIGIRTETSGLSAPSTPFLREVSRQMNAYFDDPHIPFALPLSPLGTPYQKLVWQAMTEIPPRTVKSYGQLAGELHSGARAVAGACRANRFPIIVPCHRVVGAHGIGGYCGVAGGAFLDIKRWLLRHEGHECF